MDSVVIWFWVMVVVVVVGVCVPWQRFWAWVKAPDPDADDVPPPSVVAAAKALAPMAPPAPAEEPITDFKQAWEQLLNLLTEEKRVPTRGGRFHRRDGLRFTAYRVGDVFVITRFDGKAAVASVSRIICSAVEPEVIFIDEPRHTPAPVGCVGERQALDTSCQGTEELDMTGVMFLTAQLTGAPRIFLENDR